MEAHLRGPSPCLISWVPVRGTVVNPFLHMKKRRLIFSTDLPKIALPVNG